MSSLIFHELPPGPTPLFLGETQERVAEVGRLLLDHATHTVRFVPNDPYETCIIPEHSRQRFAVWEIEALMPRRQLVALYEDAKPLLERLQIGTTLRRGENRWIRSRTPEADAADLIIGDMTAEPAIAPIEWVASHRELARRETALEYALRVFGQPAPVMRALDRDAFANANRHYLQILGHVQAEGRSTGSIALNSAKNIHLSHSLLDVDAVMHMADRKIAVQAKNVVGSSRTAPLLVDQIRALREQEKRMGLPGQWAKLLEPNASRRYFI